MQLQPKTHILPPQDCLAGRSDYAYELQEHHSVFGTPLSSDPADFGSELGHIVFGMGCFWGAERLFWEVPGVVSTVVGYQGGVTTFPTYAEVCAGTTNHAEVVAVIYDQGSVPLETLLKVFWENHDPTQEHRQGNDIGTQYRSAIFHPDEVRSTVEHSRTTFTKVLSQAGAGPITTDVQSLTGKPFYMAEAKHQQYLHKNPDGYCNLGPHGLSCPIGEPSK